MNLYIADQEILEEVQDVCFHYKEARKAFSRLEKVSNGFPEGIANEFRSSLYHIIEALSSEDKSKILKELDESKDHLIRLIYDAYELNIIYQVDSIHDFAKSFPVSILKKNLPEYYSEIIPFIEDARNGLIEEKINRKKWKQYEDVAEQLANYKTLMLTKTPNLNNEKIVNKYILSIIIGAVIGSMITLLFFLF